MSMSKKDYELIAKSFRFMVNTYERDKQKDVLFQTAVELSIELKKDNPKFDTLKFIKACGFYGV